MRTNSFVRMAIFASTASLLLPLAACGGDSSDASTSAKDCSSVKLAYMGPLTGPSATFGTTAVKAATLAIESFEAANPGCKIGGIEKFDTQGDPGQAPALAQQIVKQTDIVGIIGPGFSGEAKAALPIFEEAGIPTITSSATNAPLADNGWKFFHRTVGNDAVDSAGGSQYVVNKLKAQTIAVIDNGQEYGKGVADLFAKQVASAGAKVVLSDTIDAAAQDYSSTVIAVNAKKPDLVYCGCLYPEAGRLLKQLRSGGSSAKFVAPSGTYSPDFVKDAGVAAAEGAYITAAAAPIGHFEGYAEFAAKWKTQFNSVPDVFSPEAYDAATAYLTAMKAGNLDRQSINNWLGKDCDFAGLSGQIKFSSNGDREQAGVAIYQVKAGEFEYIDSETVSAH